MLPPAPKLPAQPLVVKLWYLISPLVLIQRISRVGTFPALPLGQLIQRRYLLSTFLKTMSTLVRLATPPLAPKLPAQLSVVSSWCLMFLQPLILHMSLDEMCLVMLPVQVS